MDERICMMCNRGQPRVRFLRAGLILLSLCALVRAETPAAQGVHGELLTLGDLRVLRVWGTPREQGFAQGSLLGEDGIKLIDAYLKGQGGEDAVKAYEVASFVMAQKMKILPRYQEEMQGMIEGMRAKLGASTIVPVLGRAIEYRDIVAINCIPETARVGCSSFAAWGAMTRSGETIAGRNLDWFKNPALKGSQVLVARISSPVTGTLGWVSLTWPGFVGCLTGMNAEGVTVSVHDAPADAVTDGGSLTPRGLILREALETAHSASAIGDITKVLRGRTSMVGNNVPVAMPYLGKGVASAVFEYDGAMDNGHGVTVRLGDIDDNGRSMFQICTNHYRKRAEASSCGRYSELQEGLARFGIDGKTLDVATAWELLRGVAVSGRIVTYQSVVFEPNRKKMHIAVSPDGLPATLRKPATVDVAELLRATGK